MKYQIQTYGCQMNVYDTESMKGLLNAAGHVITPNEDEAEMILLNTCAVREGAETRIRGRVGQLKRFKESGPLRYLGICGCMGQKEGERLTRDIPYLDLVMGPGAIGSLARLVDRLERGNGPVVDITGIDDDFDRIAPIADESISYPRFVTVMKGCNKKCAYCVVPGVRGQERSRAPRIILDEVETLVQRGYKEVTLIGQTVNGYRHGDVRFPDLLRMVHDIDGLKRIRFTTSYPGIAAKATFEIMASLEKVCEQLHYPVQSGSNRVLKSMKRAYTREKYLEQIDYCRSLFDDRAIQPFISTDIIVGFPGETDEDFEETLDLVKQVRFDSAYMFKFSPRPGTPAAESDNPVSNFVKSQRLDRLLKLQHEFSFAANRNAVGKKVEAMVERIEPKVPAPFANPPDGEIVYESRLRTGRTVVFHAHPDAYQVGDILQVTIDDCSSYAFFGTSKRNGKNQNDLK